MTTLQQVHVRVTDAATGKPTPCRVRFTDAQGTYFAPYGRLTDFATSYGVDVGGNVLADGKKYAYIDGSCEIALPPGKVIVEVHKGPEYKPLLVEHQLAAGKLALRLTLERWIDLREEGWYSGDSRAHFLSPYAALLEGMAEDLAVVNLLALECKIADLDETGERIALQPWAHPNLLAFSGQRPALEGPGHIVVVNTLNSHPWLGRLGLLNCHRVVYPLRFGAPGDDDWTLADWCHQCHRKGGLVVWLAGGLEEWGEALANAILGRVDAVEIDGLNWDADQYQSSYPCEWLADCGVFLPAVAGSGKVSNAEALGSVRTYARLQPGEKFSYGAWIDAIRSGRTFVTKGPILELTVNGQGPGSLVDIPANKHEVHLRLEARSLSLFDHVNVYYPGGMISARATGSPATAVIEKTIPLQSSGTIYARCCPSNDPSSYEASAFTSPVRVCLPGQSPAFHPHVIRLWRERLLDSMNRLVKKGRFGNKAQAERLLSVFDEALVALKAHESPPI